MPTFAKIAGLWRAATPFIKVAGVWRAGMMWNKVAGVWRAAANGMYLNVQPQSALYNGPGNLPARYTNYVDVQVSFGPSGSYSISWELITTGVTTGDIEITPIGGSNSGVQRVRWVDTTPNRQTNVQWRVRARDNADPLNSLQRTVNVRWINS